MTIFSATFLVAVFWRYLSNIHKPMDVALCAVSIMLVILAEAFTLTENYLWWLVMVTGAVVSLLPLEMDLRKTE